MLLFSFDSDTDDPESATTPAYRVPVGVPEGTGPEQVIELEPPAAMLPDEQLARSASLLSMVVFDESRSWFVKLPVAVCPPLVRVTEQESADPVTTDEGHATLATEMSAGVAG